MQRLVLWLVQLVVGLFRLLPFWLIYRLSDGLAFLLYRVLGYRKKVVFENLRRAFPEKNEVQLHQLALASYRNLTDVTLETLKSYTLSRAEVLRRCPPVNPELLNRYADLNQPVVLMGGHLGNWEYTGLSIPSTAKAPIITAYKPLSNKYLDRYVDDKRHRMGMQTVNMADIYRAMRKRVGEAAVFILLSDQSPGSRKSAQWVDLFGTPTASLPGGDVLARKFQYPVLYMVARRLRRGFYELHYTLLWADPATANEKDITTAFTRQLEADIRANPEQWLWSHRRWKMKPEEQAPA